jgi:hypothetical protein
MDSRDASLIEAEVRHQLELIDKVRATIADRVARMAAGEAVVVEGAAFHVNNFYSAVEDLLRIVAAAFENNIDDVSRWHSELIDRMTLDIPGVRPPLLSAGAAQLLHRLRSFRHFFRHAYRVELNPDEVLENVARTSEVHPLLLADVERFLGQLRAVD